MNKSDLIESARKSLGNNTPRAQAERAVDAVIEAIKIGLKKDHSVLIVGFGSFKVTTRKARIGVNPKTGEKIKIAASKGVKFAAGKELKAKIGK